MSSIGRKKSLQYLLVSGAIILGLSLITTQGNAAGLKVGESCSPQGATYKDGKTNFVCSKSGTATVWKISKSPSPSPKAEELFIMPKVVGMNLQLAQDLLQSKGSYIMDQEDFKGLGRFQLVDSNWKVCTQSPSAGKKVPISTLVTLASVKLTERC